MNTSKAPAYPFTAIVGQEKLKKALLLNAISPAIGGVLLRGEKGTGKSMAVRSLASLLPEIAVVAGCPFMCEPGSPAGLCDRCNHNATAALPLPGVMRQIPLVELPVGATEDRLVGTIDIEQAIRQGEKRFEPGLLAAANRGILYIDEVNLLDDHLVDILLDAAAMGVNYVEREGVSFSHPARFILVGTMNPEEGDLRPQLLDRFGLAVEVKGLAELPERMEIVRRRVAFERDPFEMARKWEGEQERLRSKIAAARKLLPQVQVGEPLLELISRICMDLGVDGHRADIVTYKTAMALAAFHGRLQVTVADVEEAAELALPHRQRRSPFDQPHLDQEQMQQTLQKWRDDQEKPPDGQQQAQEELPNPFPTSGLDSETGSANGDASPQPPDQGEQAASGEERIFAIGDPYAVRRLMAKVRDHRRRQGSGRRSESCTTSKSGAYVGAAIPPGEVTDLALDATLRAAAPHQLRRRAGGAHGTAIAIEECDLREKVRRKRVRNLILFVLDTSGSMGAQERMVATKGAVISLLTDAYQRRDRVGLVTFRDQGAELVLPFTNSVELARQRLAELPTGGRTPLAHGLDMGIRAIGRQTQSENNAIPLLVLISDGRANVSMGGGDPVDEAKQLARIAQQRGIQSVVIDTEHDAVNLGLMREIAAALGAPHLRLEQIKSAAILRAIKAD